MTLSPTVRPASCRPAPAALVLTVLGALAACDRGEPPAPEPAAPAAAEATKAPATAPAPAAPSAAALPDSLPNALLVASSQFEIGPDGRATAQPGAALLEIVRREGGEWRVETLEDPESNVFHKALVWEGPGGPGIVTLGATGAAVKLWTGAGDGRRARTLWKASFGGRFDRMRDAEIADLDGDGTPDLAVATHDQGVVAALLSRPDGTVEVKELGRQADTFIHEIEIGDLDGDGTPEVYATPSEPNDLSGGAQAGEVIRFVPRTGEGRTVVADLGDRHAKEILVEDVDGDGRDELYVAVEAKTEGAGADLRVVEGVEIRRYDAGTPPGQGAVVARIDDRFTRFLTAGDVDGDGKKELVAASFKSGLWLLRPGSDPRGEWGMESIDRDSSGFEHAALLADLDADGRDELYVAADDQGELRRYVWVDGRARRSVIRSREVPASRMTWNLVPVPVSMLR